MEQFKRAKVVMLSTNKFSRKNELVIDNSKLLGIHLPQNPEPSLCYSQHLYIISDDEIKKGDWYLNSLNSYTLHQYKNEKLPSYGVKKIIATTDKSLTVYQGICFTGEKVYISLPQPSPQFIEKYIEEYNKSNIITDILVEYNNFGKTCNCNGSIHDGCDYLEDRIELKINPKDNTITIKKIKDSFSLQEMKHNLRSVIGLCKQESNFNLEDWINKNL